MITKKIREAAGRAGINFLLANNNWQNQIMDEQGNGYDLFLLISPPEVTWRLNDVGVRTGSVEVIHFFLGFYGDLDEIVQNVNSGGSVEELLEMVRENFNNFYQEFLKACDKKITGVDYVLEFGDLDFNLNGIKGRIIIEE
jgi:hypothetical protein